MVVMVDTDETWLTTSVVWHKLLTGELKTSIFKWAHILKLEP